MATATAAWFFIESSRLEGEVSRELERLEVIQRGEERRLTRREASEVLRLGVRQVRRLCRAHRDRGAVGLISGKRGKRSNRRRDDAFKKRVLEALLARYSDFGPTLVAKQLLELHEISVSRETLRSWMIEDELWMHASCVAGFTNHATGENATANSFRLTAATTAGSRSALHVVVFIDDATSEVLELHLCVSESAFTYFDATKSDVQRHGKPVAFYSDEAAVFRLSPKKNPCPTWSSFRRASVKRIGSTPTR